MDFLPLAPDPQPISGYQPIVKYALDLKNGSKPESATEDLFIALWKDILEKQPTRQVGVTEGFVDFMVPERLGRELIPLCGQVLNFHALTGSTRAFPAFSKIFGPVPAKHKPANTCLANPTRKYELLEFDRLTQSPNDGVAMKYRLKVLSDFLDQ